MSSTWRVGIWLKSQYSPNAVPFTLVQVIFLSSLALSDSNEDFRMEVGGAELKVMNGMLATDQSITLPHKWA